MRSRAKALAAEGEFGDFFYAEGEYFHNVEGYLHGPNGERTWRSLNPYAGILGGGPHPYDTLRWLTGAATEVSAYRNAGRRRLDRDADDFQVALFKAPGRAMAAWPRWRSPAGWRARIASTSRCMAPGAPGAQPAPGAGRGHQRGLPVSAQDP